MRSAGYYEDHQRPWDKFRSVYKYSGQFRLSYSGPDSFDTLLWRKNPKSASSSSSFTYNAGEKCAVLGRLCTHRVAEHEACLILHRSIFDTYSCVTTAYSSACSSCSTTPDTLPVDRQFDHGLTKRMHAGKLRKPLNKLLLFNVE